MRDMSEHAVMNNSRAKFKQRIAGGAVLLIVLAIFLPFIFSHVHLDSSTPQSLAADTQPEATLSAAPEAQPPAEPAAASSAVSTVPEISEPAVAAPPQSVEPPQLSQPFPSESEQTLPQPAAGNWVVQVGSFSEQTYAKLLVTKLQQKNISAYIQPGPNHNFRVYVGPMGSYKQASQMQQKLNKQLQLAGIIKDKDS